MTAANDWFSGSDGRRLWKIERRRLAELCDGLTGRRALQIGPASETQSAILPLEFSERWHWLCGQDAIVKPLVHQLPELPLQCDSIDLLVMRHCLSADADSQRLLAESTRVLRPGGYLIVSFLNAHGYLGLAAGRRRRIPRLSDAQISVATKDLDLHRQHSESIGIGGLGQTLSGYRLPGLLQGVGNLCIVRFTKRNTPANVHRVRFRLPSKRRTSSTLPVGSGMVRKTGT